MPQRPEGHRDTPGRSVTDDQTAALYEHGSAALLNHGADCSAIPPTLPRRSITVSDGETVNGS
jgi:hypothetical protein